MVLKLVYNIDPWLELMCTHFSWFTQKCVHIFNDLLYDNEHTLYPVIGLWYKEIDDNEYTSLKHSGDNE